MTFTLYYKAGACSLAPHIVACEAGIPLDLVSVDLATKKTETGDDYLAVNPKGYVPALELDNGQVLTEVAVVVQYLADRKPEASLIPPAGSLDRYRVQEWLAFTGAELHKNYFPLFVANAPEAAKELARSVLAQRLKVVDQALARNPFLTGDTFTVADAYAWVVLSWSRRAGVDLSAYPGILRFLEDVRARPAVQRARSEEGLA
ncbi:glutathione transferase GstA [Rhodoligotrophos defluvii]|uniref:glutathione transferase GstA n=1 Tax=Rhodoligotrophos defluvii TaxID=2561934 RepID=UPI0010C9B2E3|nr:glutathione transferase GstA [Rhodoligotrophos defluvii]